MHIQSTNKCLDNTWKGSENKASCCYENLSCCHIPSIVHSSFSMSQRDSNERHLQWSRGWMHWKAQDFSLKRRMREEDKTEVIISQIQQTGIHFTNLIGF